MAMPDPDDIAAIWQLLGFDPEQTQTVVLTPATAIGVAMDYPEPLDPPQEEINHGE